ncbi:CapA family protein [uncultured Corynebacterium sp.]|uniref:CapA family protein n=1 Tax=uncultured Corynebacterium sp. TaxID=159447 RepID=UPI0025E0FD2B|nr:CapA family protein [uncultured Corynebacterium sp.]
MAAAKRRPTLIALLIGILIGAATMAGVGYGLGWVGDGSPADPDTAARADGDGDPAATPRSGAGSGDGGDGTSSSEETVTVSLSGDLLWHEEVWTSGQNPDGTWDFTDMFADVKPLVDGADFAVCHQETIFAPPEGPYSAYPSFQTPPQVVDGIRDTGWDMCTTASNHSVDAGTEGLVRTLDTFDAAGVLHSGAARSPEEMAEPRIFTTDDGVRIGVVTGTYATNGIPVEEPWLLGDLDPDALLAKAAATRAAGADIVMVAMHAGDEGVTAPTQQQLDLADVLTRSPDVDVVYGHHIHAVQPIEQVNGKWVIYGLGNMVAHQSAETTLSYEGITVELEFAREAAEGDGWTVRELTYVPTIITPHGTFPVRVAPISTLMGHPDADRARLDASLARTREAVFSRGLDPAMVTEG